MKKILLLAIIGLTIKLNSQTQAYLDINQVKALILNRNDMFWKPDPNNTNYGTPAYEVPKGSNKHCNFSNSVSIGGFDNTNQLHMSAMTYRQKGFDFWPGPLDTIEGVAPTATAMAAYDRLWKVNYMQIDSFLNTEETYAPAADIVNWPGNGNIANGNSQALAPYVDVNNDGHYNSTSGDYPKIKGDEMVYYVVNDKYGIHEETGGLPMGIEMHVSAYAYGCPNILAMYPELAYTTFHHYKIINRSNNTYTNTMIGIWCDADLGNYNNDYIGCDTIHKIGYMYNGTSNDPGVYGYGNYPPILSYQVLQSPGTKFSNFMRYNSNIGSVPPATTNPTVTADYYNYMASYWKNGTKLKADSMGYLVSNSAPQINYIYPGNPQTNTGWTEAYRNNAPGDRRFIIGNGPFTFNSHSTIEFEFSILTTFDSTAGGYKNISKVVQQNNNIAAFYTLTNKPACVVTSTATGINEFSSEKVNMQLIPNPTSDYVTIIPDKNIIGAEVRLYNNLGQIVFYDKAEMPSYRINLKELPNGFYFVEIKGKGFKGTTKIIKN